MKEIDQVQAGKVSPDAGAQLRRRLPSLRRIIGGGIGFVAFSAAGLIGAYLWYPSQGDRVFSSLPVPAVLLLLLLVGLDFLLGGLRYSIFFNGGALPRISLWRCMCANWANMLMGVVTPFQTGGGPAQIYMMWREGARVSEAVLISLLTFLATLLFFLVGSGVTIFMLSAGWFDPSLLSAIQACFLVITGIALFVLMLVLFPSRGVALVRWLAAGVARVFPSLAGRVDRFLEKTEEELEAFRAGLRGIVKRHPATIPIMVVLTMALFFNKYLIGYIIAKALEPSVPFDTFIGLQVIQHLIIYYAPTPGASGLAGISATWLLKEFLSPEHMITYIVVWRLTTTILGALLGVGVVVDALRSPAQALRRRIEPVMEPVSTEVT